MAFHLLTSCARMLASAWPSWYPAQLKQALRIPMQIKLCTNLNPGYYNLQRSVFSEEELLNRARFLASQFKTKEEEMVQLLLHHQPLVTMGLAKFQKMSQLLAQHSITTQQILTYPDIYHYSYETVVSQIRQLEDMDIRPISIHRIKKIMNERLVLEPEACEQSSDTFHFLSEHAGLSLPEAEKIFNKCLWLQNTRLSALKEKVDILQQYGISPEALREKVEILALSPYIIRTRLEKLKSLGIQFGDIPENVLTHSNFKLSLKCYLKEKAILQASKCADKHQYLCYRLACTQTELEGMMKRFPGKYWANLSKLKTNLDLLVKECNIAPSEIVNTPRVLLHSTATLQNRIKRLNEAGLSVNCKVLARSSRWFEEYISEHSPKAT